MLRETKLYWVQLAALKSILNEGFSVPLGKLKKNYISRRISKILEFVQLNPVKLETDPNIVGKRLKTHDDGSQKPDTNN